MILQLKKLVDEAPNRKFSLSGIEFIVACTINPSLLKTQFKEKLQSLKLLRIIAAFYLSIPDKIRCRLQENKNDLGIELEKALITDTIYDQQDFDQIILYLKELLKSLNEQIESDENLETLTTSINSTYKNMERSYFLNETVIELLNKLLVELDLNSLDKGEKVQLANSISKLIDDLEAFVLNQKNIFLKYSKFAPVFIRRTTTPKDSGVKKISFSSQYTDKPNRGLGVNTENITAFDEIPSTLSVETTSLTEFQLDEVALYLAIAKFLGSKDKTKVDLVENLIQDLSLEFPLALIKFMEFKNITGIRS